MNNLDPQSLVLKTDTIPIHLPETWEPPAERRRKPRFTPVPASEHLTLDPGALTYRKDPAFMLAKVTAGVCLAATLVLAWAVVVA